MIKGSIAGATGVALLMGGFGTYALWSDSEDLEAGTVQSGELDIATSTGTWDDTRTAGAGDWSASHKLVPGDVVTYTQVFDVKATGKNMKGQITYTPATLTGDFTTLQTDVDVTSNSGTVTETAPDSNNFVFTGPFGTAELTAVVTYTLPASTSNQVDQDAEGTLPAAQFLIEQTN
jgi:alternate signal-mediated exported protein